MKVLENKKIAIIGTGHIGRALFEGLVRGKKVSVDSFILTNHHVEKLSDVHKKFGVNISNDNNKAIRDGDIILLCVRPRDMKRVIDGAKQEFTQKKLIISVAACVPLALLEKYFGRKDLQIIRIIPNIPVAFGEGVVGWLDNGKVTKENLNDFKELFSTLGQLIRCVNDDTLEKLSMIAGCGIGYVAYFMKQLEEAAKNYGFARQDAQKISRLVFSGTIKHMGITNSSPDKLVEAVATKGGITEEVLQSLERGKFPSLFQSAIQNGYDKVRRLTAELENEKYKPLI